MYILESVREAKHLGIIVSAELSWSPYVHCVIEQIQTWASCDVTFENVQQLSKKLHIWF